MKPIIDILIHHAIQRSNSSSISDAFDDKTAGREKRLSEVKHFIFSAHFVQSYLSFILSYKQDEDEEYTYCDGDFCCNAPPEQNTKSCRKISSSTTLDRSDDTHDRDVITMNHHIVNHYYSLPPASSNSTKSLISTSTPKEGMSLSDLNTASFVLLICGNFIFFFFLLAYYFKKKITSKPECFKMTSNI